MYIIADQAIPSVVEAFSSIAEVKTVDGRYLKSADLKGADALLVRSISKVDSTLLSGSGVEFVGSATSGIDHIDTDYLQQNNIQFANAAGSNARAVAEYVVCALLALSERLTENIDNKTIGIIGYGHVGKQLASIAQQLGLQVIINDPPLEAADKHPSVPFVELSELLERADIVSLHVPMITTGLWPTQYMVNEVFLSQLKKGSWLINTSRGAVAETDAVLKYLQAGGVAVLDVWEHEPNISQALLQATTLATPHVAGYSQDAKLNATKVLYDSLCQTFGLKSNWAISLPAPEAVCDNKQQALSAVIKQTYDITVDDADLRAMLKQSEQDRAVYFDQLRTGYSFRREFSAWKCKPLADVALQETLKKLGFDF